MAHAKVICSDCGATLSAEDSFCSRCGARIEGAQGIPRPQKEKRKSAEPKDRRRTKLEPWQILTGTVVVLLVAYFLYTELNRPTAGDQPPQVAPQNQSFGPPAAELMQQIEQQQARVDANPTDKTEIVRLANMLHDAALQNPTLLNRAINMYARYLAVNPTDPNARVDMGICYFELAKFDSTNAGANFGRAIDAMQAALKSDPRHQPAAFNLGIVTLNMGDLEASTRWFKKAIDLDPNSDLGKKAQQIVEQHTFPTPAK
jgi:tetratricopeptide (TPR) repeat protein